ncbi:E3 ubiquitin-protein ligase RNF25, partial [Geodia barretti]
PNQRGAGALEQRVHGGDEDVENRRVTSPLSRRFSTSYGGNGGVRSLPSHHRETTSLEFHLTPSTADDKEQQFVYLDLCLGIPATYPQTPPTLNLLQSRGLADAHLTNIREGLVELCSELVGSPMVYQMVEWVKESLTNHNRPCGQCALCLSDFTEEEVEFRKTDCYHYFHTLCLLRYIDYHRRLLADEEREEMGRRKGKRERVLECPVCRNTIPNNSVCVRGEGEEREEEEEEEEKFVFVPSSSLRQWQSHMAAMLERQKERGGVIDLSDKDAVIDETWVRAPPPTDDGRTKVETATVPSSDQHSESSPREPHSRTTHSSSQDSRTTHSSSQDSRTTHSSSQDSRTAHSSSRYSKSAESSSPNSSSEPRMALNPRSGSTSYRGSQRGKPRGNRDSGPRTKYRTQDPCSGSRTGDPGMGTCHWQSRGASRDWRSRNQKRTERVEFGDGVGQMGVATGTSEIGHNSGGQLRRGGGRGRGGGGWRRERERREEGKVRREKRDHWNGGPEREGREERCVLAS